MYPAHNICYNESVIIHRVGGEHLAEAKLSDMNSDYWLPKLKSILHSDVGRSRPRYMLAVSFYYAIAQLEKIPEDQLQFLYNSFTGFKGADEASVMGINHVNEQVESLAQKWEVDQMADFVDKVSLVSATNVIAGIAAIIRQNESLSDEQKDQLIQDIYLKDIMNMWFGGEQLGKRETD